MLRKFSPWPSSLKLPRSLADWLETHWVAPAYSGWLLAGFALCFFAAATNTLAGWLYVLSGTIVALLGLGAVMPLRSLGHLQVQRLPIAPASAGGALKVELEIQNPAVVTQTLLQIWDLVPDSLGPPQKVAVEAIQPQQPYRWTYWLPAPKRGIYHWQEVGLRTGSPLGLFWCRRRRTVPAKAAVYPQVLSLKQCPLLDAMGQAEREALAGHRRYQAAAEGVTRTLRPYRHGDPIRSIHWRTSARLGEFKVRELEVMTGGRDLSLCLDSAWDWEEESFERAVTAAASLYVYASRCQLNVRLWTAPTGWVRGHRGVMETLAGLQAQPGAPEAALPDLPLLWLTQNGGSLDSLPGGSRWLFFLPEGSGEARSLPGVGLAIAADRPLQPQLEAAWR